MIKSIRIITAPMIKRYEKRRIPIMNRMTKKTMLITGMMSLHNCRRTFSIIFIHLVLLALRYINMFVYATLYA